MVLVIVVPIRREHQREGIALVPHIDSSIVPQSFTTLPFLAMLDSLQIVSLHC